MTRHTTATEIHPLRCGCAACEPYEQAEHGLAAAINRVARRILAGFVAGQAIVVVLDWAIGGPGPFVVFGL